MSVPRCGDCRFFKLKDPVFNDGECHRHAPRPEFSFAQHYTWPVVEKDDFCGEFADRFAVVPEPMICDHGVIGSTCHLCLGQSIGRSMSR